MVNDNINNKNVSENKLDERVLYLRRVSKKTTGGSHVSFSALVAVGDGKGRVGIGIGRGLEVPPAIQKAITQAKKRMILIPFFNDTLPHEIKLKYKSSILLLKPAPPGTGLKVGGVVRSVLDIAGLNNASGKIIGTRNQITNAYAVMNALKKLKPRIVVVKKESSKELDKHTESPSEIQLNKVENKDNSKKTSNPKNSDSKNIKTELKAKKNSK